MKKFTPKQLERPPHCCFQTSRAATWIFTFSHVTYCPFFSLLLVKFPAQHYLDR